MSVIIDHFSKLSETLYTAYQYIDGAFSLITTLSSYLQPFIGSMMVIAMSIWLIRFLLLR